jgi:hypothetical protein
MAPPKYPYQTAQIGVESPFGTLFDQQNSTSFNDLLQLLKPVNTNQQIQQKPYYGPEAAYLSGMLLPTMFSGLDKNLGFDFVGADTNNGFSSVATDTNIGGESAGPSSSGGVAPSLGSVSQGLSGLAALSQNADIAQFAQTLGQVAAIGSAANQAAQGNFGQAAFSLGPTVGQALGIPGVAIGMGMTAAQAQADPTMSSNLTMGSLASQAINAAAPALGLISAISGLIGGPTTKSIANDAITDALADQANTMAEQQNMDTLDALMAITGAFGTMAAEAQAQAQAQAEEGAAIAAGFGDPGVATGETGVSAVGEAMGGAPSGGGADNGGAAADGGSSAGDGSAGLGDGTGGVYARGGAVHFYRSNLNTVNQQQDLLGLMERG